MKLSEYISNLEIDDSGFQDKLEEFVNDLVERKFNELKEENDNADRFDDIENRISETNDKIREFKDEIIEAISGMKDE